jgi:lysophospholipase L1-like esterase
VTLPADWLVRFARPLTLLESHDLPAGEAVEAPALGLAPDALAAHRSELAGRLRPLGVAAPFRAGEVVVGLGDSITADALSWFEQIAAGGGGARFVNAGLSGDTTADLRKRAFRIAALRPDWILAMAGTNDCQRHGPREERLVSEAETLRNLLALDAALRRTGARVVWVTPPPVDEAGLGAELARRGLRFRAADLRSVADAMRAVSEEVIDIQPRFTGWEDGVHPTADGQRLIAERVVRSLISANVNGGR